MGIVGDRGEISKTSPMPVNDVTISTDIVQKTGESVSITAGAAGTAVAVVVDKAPIYNSTGVRVGHKEDSSFAFVTGTCLTTEIDPLNVTGDGSLVPKGGGLYVLLDRLEAAHATAAVKLAQVTSGFTNGQFVVDYENGIVYGIKATTGTSDTVNYKTRALTIVAVGTGGAVSALVDDAAFGIGSSLVTPAGFIADETSTDSVDEGDVGAARMTLTRKIITASDFLEDAQHTSGDYGSFVLSVRNDTLAALAGTDGDYAPFQVDALGALFVQGPYAEDAQHVSGAYGHLVLAVRNDAGAVLAGADGDYVPFTTDASGNLRVTTGGGGSAGGGNNTYSTEQGDFTATVTDATTNIVLSVDSIGGVAIDENNFANAILKVWDATNDEMVQITLDDFTWTAGTKTLATANCTGSFTFNTGDIVSLTIVGPDKMRDYAADAQKSVEQSPIYTRYTGDTLATLTNIAANTTAYLYLDMDGYKYFALQCETSGTTPTDTLTLTVEASWQDDGTADSSCTYQDVTNDWFGVASVVDADVTFDKDTPCTAKFVRLKYVTSNTGGSDADLTVYARRSY